MPIPKEEKEIVVIEVDLVLLEKQLENRGSYGLVHIREIMDVLRKYVHE